jgi:hypothetical protein
MAIILPPYYVDEKYLEEHEYEKMEIWYDGDPNNVMWLSYADARRYSLYFDIYPPERLLELLESPPYEPLAKEDEIQEDYFEEEDDEDGNDDEEEDLMDE